MGHFLGNTHFHNFFVNNSHSKLYENLRNSLVTDIRSQVDREIVTTQDILFYFMKTA
jgi:hypothetical protein